MFNLDDYETVEERLIKYWKDNPEGRVFTRLIEFSATRFIVEAHIYRSMADTYPWATGLAEETVQGRGVNATSALENCETSAIGRALANAGYATKGKRASREEMAKVKSKVEVQTLVEQTKEKLKESAGEYIPVTNPEDPWTVVPAKQGQTVAQAVELLEQTGFTQPILPTMRQCKCKKDMVWRTGQQKSGKPWASFNCTNVPSRKCMDAVWFEIKDGQWIEQVKK